MRCFEFGNLLAIHVDVLGEHGIGGSNLGHKFERHQIYAICMLSLSMSATSYSSLKSHIAQEWLAYKG